MKRKIWDVWLDKIFFVEVFFLLFFNTVIWWLGNYFYLTRRKSLKRMENEFVLWQTEFLARVLHFDKYGNTYWSFSMTAALYINLGEQATFFIRNPRSINPVNRNIVVWWTQWLTVVFLLVLNWCHCNKQYVKSFVLF